MKVSLKEKSHKAYFKKLEQLPAVLKDAGMKGMDFFVLTDRKVKRLYGSRLAMALAKAKANFIIEAVPEGEKSKSFASYQRLLGRLNAFDGTRVKPAVVAFGGGVVGDLGGFLAASYKRGVPLLQVPTTLLAQVDSSLGGKTGIDHPAGKNLVGAFYQPRGILVDSSLLKTLSAEDYTTGLAEVVKYGVIKDAALFSALERKVKQIKARDAAQLRGVVRRCLEIKRRLVEQDEYDCRGARIILNFGHTIGHAAESAARYSLPHGQAVAVGMLCASALAVALKIFPEKGLARLYQLLAELGLPTRYGRLSWREIRKSMAYDKKFTKGKNCFVLPVAIGRVKVVEDIPETLIKSVVELFIR